jgi:hypothetical protein
MSAGGEKSPAGVSPEQDREVVLAALAGTTVERLFLGGPLDGEVHSMAPDQRDWIALWPQSSHSVSSMLGSTEILDEEFTFRECRYRAQRYRHPEVGERYVMVAGDVGDLDRALYQWLAKRWLAEAPERKP